MEKEITHSISKNIAERSAEKARRASGWKQWLLAAVAALAGAIAWFTQGDVASHDEKIIPSARPDTQAPAP